MNVVALSLMLLQIVLEEAVKNNAAEEFVQTIQAAIASLQKVHGTDVTFEQLESLRTAPMWDKVVTKP